MADDPLFDAAFLRTLERLRVAARHKPVGRSAGVRTGRRAGPGLEFAEHRAYVPGDDPRQLDWAAYGRLGRLLLRLCQVEQDLAVYLLVDASGSMATGRVAKFDHARRVAAALAYVALAGLEEVRVACLGAGTCRLLAAGRGRSRLPVLLDFLRGAEAAGPTDLAAAAGTFVPHAPRPGLAVWLTDLADPAGYERGLLALAGRGVDLWVLHLTDPADTGAGDLGDLTLQDAETGETLAVHVTPEVRHRVATEAAGFAAEAEAWCRERGIGFARVSTEVGVDVLVLDVLRRSGLLR